MGYKVTIQEEWKLENGKYKCPFCNKEFSRNGISTHIWRTHGEGKDHKPFLNKEPWNKGEDKQTNSIVKSISIKAGEKRKGKPGKKHSEESKEKIRKKRFEYLSKRTGKTAWERRHNKEMSYLEQKFYDEVILKHNLLLKYDINYDYPQYPYFIDFAFLNVKLAVELDGSCHFKNGKRIDHDIKKDEILIDKGWKVFRIAYNDNFDQKIDELFDILKNIDDYNYNPKSLESRLYRGKQKV